MIFRAFMTLVVLLATPNMALAHGSVVGAGNFYNGLLHPLFVPAHFLLLSALSLLLAQQPLHNNKTHFMVFIITVVIGLSCAWFAIGKDPEILLLASTAVVGVLVVLKPKLSVWLGASIAACVGLMVGLDSKQADLSGLAKFTVFCGSGIGITLFIVYPFAILQSFKVDTVDRFHWLDIAIRVLGSWAAACALLVLALSVASYFS